MGKRRIAICMEDEVYTERFVRCMMNHYCQDYEMHMLSSVSEIAESEGKDRYDLLIMGDAFYENPGDMAGHMLEHGQQILVLKEGADDGSYEESKIRCIEKYQEVYKIEDEIKQLLCTGTSLDKKKGDYLLAGVFSVTCENGQLPFVAACAEIYAEKGEVLILDTQPYSGLDTEETGEVLGMEDLMSIATTGVYTGSRLLASIGHEPKWDYIRPVKNTECLAEANVHMYRTMIDILAKEFDYKIILLNFGGIFSGMFDLMCECDILYWLGTKEQEGKWREQVFIGELRRREKEQILKESVRIEIPTGVCPEDNWRKAARQCLWGSTGTQIRTHVWEKGNAG